MAEETFQIDTGKSSKYNAGILQVQRINKVLDKINECRNNLWAHNTTDAEFSYKVLKSNIDSLFKETFAKFASHEIELCKKLQKVANEVMVTFPVYDKKNRPMPENKLKVEKAIDVYESVVKYFADKHEWFSPDKEDPRKAAMKR
jgi:hypothetical protein